MRQDRTASPGIGLPVLSSVLRVTIDHDAPSPLWQQLLDIMRAQIESGEWTGMIPSEPHLCQRYEVSRITVRRAKKELIDEGLLTVVKGRGTFVVK